jgi:hypothetical protein
LRTLVLDAMDDNLVSDFRRQWEGDTFPRTHINLPGAPYTQLAPIVDESAIRLAAAHKLAFHPAGDDVAFSVNGAIFVLAVKLEPALAMLTDVRAIPFSELAAQVEGDEWVANLRESLETLARAGVILVDKA